MKKRSYIQGRTWRINSILYEWLEIFRKYKIERRWRGKGSKNILGSYLESVIANLEQFFQQTSTCLLYFNAGSRSYYQSVEFLFNSEGQFECFLDEYYEQVMHSIFAGIHTVM